jgi:transglutaminase-like putative cysteine protease
MPTLSFYLLAATFDRRSPDWWAPAALIVIGAVTFWAAATESSGGRARLRPSGRPLASHSLALPMTMIVILALAGTFSVFRFAAAIPESGTVAWRNPTGFGGGLFGGISYNLFASMHQDLASDSNEVVFLARVSESAPPPSELYWKLITLDTFDGTYWLPANLPIRRSQSPSHWEADDFAFRGETVLVESVVRIAALRQTYLPVLYSPRSLQSDDPLLAASHRSREDGSVKFDALTKDGLEYRVISEIPVPNLAVLATDGDALSPLFQNAQDEGFFNLPPVETRPSPASARLSALYTALPDDFPDVIGALARQVTARAGTDFERGLLLEEFFRNTGNFIYDLEASTGHSALQLEEWMLDPESRNYRRGYCEQFASAMAVMARALGIPARGVIGFAPGETQTQADGGEVIVIRARNGHMWVELYLEGQGWIRFDPTPRGDGSNPATVAALGFDPSQFLPAPTDPSQAPLSLPGSLAGIDRRFLDEALDPSDGQTLGLRAPRLDWVWWLVPVAALALVPIAKLVRRGARMRRLERGDIGAGWSELVDRLADLGQRPLPSQTPAEIAASFGGEAGLRPLADRLTAHIFGNRAFTDGRAALEIAERSIQRRYPAWRRWLVWLRPASLFRGFGRPPIRLRPRLRPVVPR